MGTNSKIEWTDHTWNPWRGCAKVSPACDNCYMFRDMIRFGQNPNRLTLAKANSYYLPAREFKAGRWKPGDKVFVCSRSDFFHPDADEWRGGAWDIIRDHPDLIFQILTKRTDRILDCLPDGWGDGWPNVWMGATVENQQMLYDRGAELLRVPAMVRYLSIEPMLGKINFRWEPLAHWAAGESYRAYFERKGSVQEYESLAGIDWVIVGGETGPGARPMHPDWVRSVRDQCQGAGIPFFFKQWGEWAPEMETVDRMRLYMRMEDDGVLGGNRTRFICVTPEGELKYTYSERDEFMTRVGKKYSGCLLDGREWKEMPQAEGRE